MFFATPLSKISSKEASFAFGSNVKITLHATKTHTK